jgi:hypothetical protein
MDRGAFGVEREDAEWREENMRSISTGAISEDALYVTSIWGFTFLFCIFLRRGKAIAPRRVVCIRQTKIDG